MKTEYLPKITRSLAGAIPDEHRLDFGVAKTRVPCGVGPDPGPKGVPSARVECVGERPLRADGKSRTHTDERGV
jgi:hypothetical protein